MEAAESLSPLMSVCGGGPESQPACTRTDPTWVAFPDSDEGVRDDCFSSVHRCSKQKKLEKLKPSPRNLPSFRGASLTCFEDIVPKPVPRF